MLFVYDYCYTTWHASVAFGGTSKDGSEPSQMVQRAYEALAYSDLCAADAHSPSIACQRWWRLLTRAGTYESTGTIIDKEARCGGNPCSTFT